MATGYSRRTVRSRFGRPWVGDLAIGLPIDARRQGEIVLELVEGGRAFQCKLDLHSGRVTLSGRRLVNFRRAAHTPRSKAPELIACSFANVDDQLLLWVDGKLIDVRRTYSRTILPGVRPTTAICCRWVLPREGTACRSAISK